MKQKLIGALIIFGVSMLAAIVGGSFSGYVRGVLADSKIETLEGRMEKTEKFQGRLHFEYVPRVEYEKDYAQLLKGLETLDGKLDRLLARGK